MKCEKIQQLLSAYVDNELSTAERRELDQHLETCAKCRQELAALQKVSNLVSSLPKVSAPYGLAERVKQQLSQRPQPVATESPWLRFLFRYRWAIGGVTTAAAAFMIVYLNIILLSRPSITPERMVVPEPTETVFAPSPKKPTTEDVSDTLPALPDAEVRKRTGAEDFEQKDKKALAELKREEEVVSGERERIVSKKGGLGIIGKAGPEFAARHDRDSEEEESRDLAQVAQPKQVLEAKESLRDESVTTLSQEVIVACRDIETQLTELERIVQDTLTRIPKAQIAEVAGNVVRFIDVPSDKQIQSQIIQLKSNINLFRRQQQFKKAPTTLQIKVSLPLEQKEYLIARLDRLGQVQVSKLRPTSVKQLDYDSLTALSQNLQEEIKGLTEDTEYYARRTRTGEKTTRAARASSPKPDESAWGFLAKAKEPNKAAEVEHALTQIEEDTIKLYDLKLQEAVKQKLAARRKGIPAEGFMGKKTLGDYGQLSNEQAARDEVKQTLKPQQKGFTLGRPSQAVMIELIITLEEKDYVIPTNK